MTASPRPRRGPDLESVVAGVIVATVLALLLAGVLAFRAKAPCAVFSVATAPVRCLPGGEG